MWLVATTLGNNALYWQGWWVVTGTSPSDMVAQPVFSSHFSTLSTRNHSWQIPWRSPDILSWEAQKKSIWHDLLLRSLCWVLTITVSCPCSAFSKVYLSRIRAQQNSVGYRLHSHLGKSQTTAAMPSSGAFLFTGLLKDTNSSLWFLFQGFLVSSQTEGLKSLRVASGLSSLHVS